MQEHIARFVQSQSRLSFTCHGCRKRQQAESQRVFDNGNIAANGRAVSYDAECGAQAAKQAGLEVYMQESPNASARGSATSAANQGERINSNSITELLNEQKETNRLLRLFLEAQEIDCEPPVTEPSWMQPDNDTPPKEWLQLTMDLDDQKQFFVNNLVPILNYPEQGVITLRAKEISRNNKSFADGAQQYLPELKALAKANWKAKECRVMFD